MIRFLDHTADVGIEVESKTLEELFRESARGMFSIICGNLEEVDCGEWVSGTVEGEDLEELLYNFLEELLYIFEVKHLILKEFDVKFIGKNLIHYRACGERFDPAKHRISTGIKSPTYHMMQIERENGSWKARIIFDV